MNSQTLRTKFKLVPDVIREWFGSDETMQKVTDLNSHFNLAGKNTVARLLFLLEIGELQPNYFNWELSKELGLDRDRAKLIGSEIKRSILNTVRKELSAQGTNIDDLDLFDVPAMPINIQTDRVTEEKPDTKRPILLKEVPGPTILRKEEVFVKSAVSAPIPRPGGGNAKNIPVPPPKAGLVPPKSPALSPFTFEKEADRPLNTPSGFKLGGIPRPNMTNVPMPPTPSRPARVELGGEAIKKVPIPESKTVGREPIHYTEPKSMFMPQAQSLKPEGARIAPPPMPQIKKIEVPVPSYPRPLNNKPDAISNSTIH